MKKIVLVFLFVFTFLSAYAINVCVYPANSEIEGRIKALYPSVEIKHLDISVSYDNVMSCDYRLYEMMRNKTESAIFLFPFKNEIAEFSHIELYLYSESGNGLEKIYEQLDQNEITVPDETLKDIAYLFLEGDELESFRTNSKAENTALTVNNIRSAVENSNEYFHDNDAYKKARNRFYWSFTGTLAAFGANVAVNSLDLQNADLKKYLNLGTYAAIGAGGVLMIWNLIKYCRYAEFIK